MGRPRSVHTEQQIADRYVGTKDAAAILGVSVSTVQKMVSSGNLRAWRTAGGHRRIALADLRGLAGDHLAPETAAKVSPPASTAPRTLDVLVVEDNAVAARAIVKVLERYGERLHVTLKGDAAEALLHVAEHVPDLLISDLVMQPFDGFHLLRVLRSSPRTAALRVLIVTGLTSEEIAARGGLPPHVLVYRKPLHADRLSGFIDALLIN